MFYRKYYLYVKLIFKNSKFISKILSIDDNISVNRSKDNILDDKIFLDYIQVCSDKLNIEILIGINYQYCNLQNLNFI